MENVTGQNRAKLVFVVEHLELEIGRWLYIEYMHASEIVGKKCLMFVNVKKAKDVVRLSRFGVVEGRSFAEIFKPEQVVILDPKADVSLVCEDFVERKAVVIGGILGDEPPMGRTNTLLTNRLQGAVARNLGKGQFTIDGAVYMAKLVSEGFQLGDIPVKNGLTIRVNDYNSVHLPYTYPLKNGEPIIHKNLIKYLRSDKIKSVF